MNIRLYFITTDQEYNALPAGFQLSNCLTSACKAVVEAHTQLKQEGVYPALDNNYGIVSYSLSEFRFQYAQAADTLKITAAPAVLFYDNDLGVVISKLKGLSVTRANIVDRYKKLLTLVPGENADGTAGYYSEGGKFFPLHEILAATDGGNFGLGLGLGLFGGGGGLPPIVWLLAAAFTGYKTLEVEKPTLKTLWGAGCALSVINYMGSKKGS